MYCTVNITIIIFYAAWQLPWRIEELSKIAKLWKRREREIRRKRERNESEGRSELEVRESEREKKDVTERMRKGQEKKG